MAEALTFKECAERYMKAHAASGRTPSIGSSGATRSQYVTGVRRAAGARDVKLSHVMEVLEPLWTTTEKPRFVCVAGSNWCWTGLQRAARDSESGRWRGHLGKLLAKHQGKQTQTSCSRARGRSRAFMARLRDAEGWVPRAGIVILTAARGEVRGNWAEIDTEKKSVGARVAYEAARAPGSLSADALALLQDLPRMAGTDYVFPAPRGGMLSDMTLTAVLRRMQVQAVPHGFRSTFRDWAAERTTYPREVAEMALAHTIGDKVEAAYRRGDLFEKRTALMADWAKFLNRVETTGQVIDMASKRAG